MMSRKSMANSAPTYIAPATGAMGVSTAATGVVIGSSTSTGSGLAGQGEGQEQLSFFERERERLIDEISGGFEELMTSTNVLNRKLEEVWGVGKEFETVAGLWGKFNTLIREQKTDPSTDPNADENVVNLTMSMQHQSLGPSARMTTSAAGGVPGTGTTTFGRASSSGR